MIHYTCDICGKPINSETDERFRVLVDIEQMRPGEDDSDLESEFSEEFDDFDFELNGVHTEKGEELFHSYKFDLCRNCAETYMNDPLAKKVSRRVRFMDN
jgi:hypothetical protein